MPKKQTPAESLSDFDLDEESQLETVVDDRVNGFVSVTFQFTNSDGISGSSTVQHQGTLQEGRGLAADWYQHLQAEFGIQPQVSRYAQSNSSNRNTPTNNRNQRSAAPQRRQGSNPKCVDCGSPIQDWTSKAGKTVTGADFAIIRERKYGRALCYECMKAEDDLG